MKNECIILGAGHSAGTPSLSAGWCACDPNEPKNNRTRSGAVLKYGEYGILIDTNPDIRQQLLRSSLPMIRGIFYTHSHADHTHGINEIRELNRLYKREIPVYSDAYTLQMLRESFEYCFIDRGIATKENYFFRSPALYPVILQDKNNLLSVQRFSFQDSNIEALSLPLYHGKNFLSYGLKINDFAYTTDVSEIPTTTHPHLYNLKLWVVSCLTDQSFKNHNDPIHTNLEKILQWYDIYNPQKMLLTHLGSRLDYQTVTQYFKETKKNISLAYDGLRQPI